MDVKNRKIRLGYSLALSILTAAVAIAFIIGAALIYYTGPDPAGHNYTYEALRRHMLVPLILLGVWILAIAGGFALSVFFPVKENNRPRADEKKALARLKKRLPREGGESFQTAMEQVKFHEWARIWVWGYVLAVCLAGAVFALVYVFTPSNYSAADFNGDILRMVKNVMPWVGTGLLLCCAASAFEYFSVRKELGAAKRAMQTGDKSSVSVPAKKSADARTQRILGTAVRVLLGAVAVVFLVVGVVNGGAQDVLSKAVNICTECIGLG